LLSNYAWHAGNSNGKTHPVGQKKPNAFGLYDMHGNVQEWCSDWLDKTYYSNSPNVYQGPSFGSARVIRGGCWWHDPRKPLFCRSWFRHGDAPSQYSNLTGFRIVLESKGTGTLSREDTLVSQERTSQSKSAELSEIKELPLAVAPFEAIKAKEYQKLTAEYLGVSLEKTVDLGSGVKMEFTLIPAGEFMIGSPRSEKDRDRDEGPRHRIKISKGFYMSLSEVTQAQWKVVMSTNPSHFKGDSLPVEQVSWNDAVEFCKKLSQQEGKTYRLPTEAEWEYACRAGTTTPFNTGETINTNQSNYHGNYIYGIGRKGINRQKTSVVGTFTPNAFGLYDMHGNVWEWCSDWYGQDYYSKSPEVDPEGPGSGSLRVLRGGSWDLAPRYCRSAERAWFKPVFQSYSHGFRVVLDLQK
jgi:formylglycine-generating enzyme required for sulfatase activity